MEVGRWMYESVVQNVADARRDDGMQHEGPVGQNGRCRRSEKNVHDPSDVPVYNP